MPAGMSLLALQRRVFSSDLTPSARLVALAILDHWSPGRPLWPSVARLAALTGLAESSVKRLLRELSDAGAFAVERRGAGGRNHYTPGPLLTGGPGLTIGPVRSHHEPTAPANPGSPSDRSGLTMGPDVPVTTETPGLTMSPDRSHHDHPRSHHRTGPGSPSAHKYTQEVTQEVAHLERAERRAANRRPRTWRFVPDDWQPSDAHRAKAQQLGVDMELEAEKFRNHEFRTPRSDADRAFHNWIANAAERSPPRRFARQNSFDPLERARRLREQERQEVSEL